MVEQHLHHRLVTTVSGKHQRGHAHPPCRGVDDSRPSSFGQDLFHHFRVALRAGSEENVVRVPRGARTRRWWEGLPSRRPAAHRVDAWAVLGGRQGSGAAALGHFGLAGASRRAEQAHSSMLAQPGAWCGRCTRTARARQSAPGHCVAPAARGAAAGREAPTTGHYKLLTILQVPKYGCIAHASFIVKHCIVH